MTRPLLSAAFGDRGAGLLRLVRAYRFEDALAALRGAAAEWRSRQRP